MTVDDLRATDITALFRESSSRYGRYLASLGEVEREVLFERIYDAYDCNYDLPLLFEDECSDRADAVAEVLASCTASERRYLKMNPADLGVRTEAYLLGLAPEELAASPRFSDRDRKRLGELAFDALLLALPVPA
jgi:hypothetical protein